MTKKKVGSKKKSPRKKKRPKAPPMLPQIVGNESQARGVTKLKFDDNTERRFSRRGIRCGLSWPWNEVPAFYVILGMEIEGDDHIHYGSNPLILLCERQVDDLSLETLFRQLGDDCTVACCSDIYAEAGGDSGEFADSFRSYGGRMNADLCPAHFPDNFAVGVSLIKDHVDKRLLELPPESILAEQLRQIRREDLKDNPEKRFFAINALRHAVAAFFRNPPVRPRSDYSRPDPGGHGPLAWMAY